LTIGKEEIYARLLVEDAPKTIKILEAELPVESRVRRAKICDNELMLPVPFNIDELENPVHSEPGHVAFFNTRQVVCIWYKEMVPVGSCNLFAKIEAEDMPKLVAEAEKIWENEGGLVKLEIVEEAQ
jgi:hypothetical protein